MPAIKKIVVGFEKPERLWPWTIVIGRETSTGPLADTNGKWPWKKKNISRRHDF